MFHRIEKLFDLKRCKLNRRFFLIYIYILMMTLRTNNVLYGGCTVARDEVCIKRNHCHPAIFSLWTGVDFSIRQNVTCNSECYSREMEAIVKSRRIEQSVHFICHSFSIRSHWIYQFPLCFEKISSRFVSPVTKPHNLRNIFSKNVIIENVLFR